MALVTLHSFPACPSCRSVLMAAQHIGLKMNIKNYDLLTGENSTPEFRKINPLGTVPVIDDNGFYLTESRAILSYLANKFAPDSLIYPKNPQDRAVVDKMLYFDIGSLYKAQGDVLFPHIFKGKPIDSEKLENFYKVLNVFEEFLSKSTYAAGEHITIADFSLISTLSLAQVANISFDKYPRICAWQKKLESEIPSYKEINEIPVREYIQRIESRNKSNQ